MLTKLPRYKYHPRIPGRPGRAEYTECVTTPPPSPPGSWKEVCSQILVEFKVNTGFTLPPGATLVVDGNGAPVIYEQDGRLFMAYLVCRTEWVPG